MVLYKMAIEQVRKNWGVQAPVHNTQMEEHSKKTTDVKLDTYSIARVETSGYASLCLDLGYIQV